ncbi:hypothetical protein BpHYR1_048869 [Brachionus plicatilis]|uniref:Uncharacterized protein n=1 Tax=Brachionus plicatilis TaxID=10195 RepID=A0A3M7Q7N1_BRAPC|nr:hypothetical protein BpHYR1_048869 [Brachionus plicatilis]
MAYLQLFCEQPFFIDIMKFFQNQEDVIFINSLCFLKNKIIDLFGSEEIFKSLNVNSPSQTKKFKKIFNDKLESEYKSISSVQINK